MVDITTRASRAYPGLPEPGNDLASHSAFLRAVKEALQVHERRTKDYQNSFVRLHELVDLGLAKIQGRHIVPIPPTETTTVVSTGGSGVTDHGALTGLADDDHTQYVLRNILTTNGDIFVRLSDAVARLGVGTEGDVLSIVSGLPAWDTPDSILSTISHQRRHTGAYWRGTWETFGPTTITEAGTVSTPSVAPSSSALTGGIPRRQVASTTGLNNGASFRDSSGLWFYRSVSGNSRLAGFEFWVRFYFGSSKSDGRYFVGLYPSSSAATLGASGLDAQLNVIGFGKEDTDTNFQIVHNDGAGTVTKVDLGVTPAGLSNNTLDLLLTCPLGGGDVAYQVIDQHSDSVLGSGTLTTNLPAADQGLTPQVILNNGGLTTTSGSIGMMAFAMRHRF